VVRWIDNGARAPVTVTAATYWQTSLDVYAAFEGVEGITEYVPAYDSPAPPLRASDVSDLCRSQTIDLVVVPFQRQNERWVAKFMEPEGERALIDGTGFGAGDETVFTYGRFRLEVVPCPGE
jgi:hypothetical protein